MKSILARQFLSMESAKVSAVPGGGGVGGVGGMLPREILKSWYCLVASNASFWYFSEQIEPSYPEYFRAYSDITRENPSFYRRLM